MPCSRDTTAIFVVFAGAERAFRDVERLRSHRRSRSLGRTLRCRRKRARFARPGSAGDRDRKCCPLKSTGSSRFFRAECRRQRSKVGEADPRGDPRAIHTPLRFLRLSATVADRDRDTERTLTSAAPTKGRAAWRQQSWKRSSSTGHESATGNNEGAAAPELRLLAQHPATPPTSSSRRTSAPRTPHTAPTLLFTSASAMPPPRTRTHHTFSQPLVRAVSPRRLERPPIRAAARTSRACSGTRRGAPKKNHANQTAVPNRDVLLTSRIFAGREEFSRCVPAQVLDGCVTGRGDRRDDAASVEREHVAMRAWHLLDDAVGAKEA
jgi:hypothetical protein